MEKKNNLENSQQLRRSKHFYKVCIPLFCPFQAHGVEQFFFIIIAICTAEETTLSSAEKRKIQLNDLKIL